MKKIFSALLLIIFSMLSTSAWGLYWVREFSGEPQDYQINRGGKLIPLNPLMQLLPEDQVRVLTKEGRLTLTSNNNKVVLKQSDSPYKVPVDVEVSGVLNNLSNWAADWWNGPKLKTLKTVVAASRGTPPIVSLGTTDDANFLFDVKDKLSVHWVGGEAPFKVTLINEKNVSVSLKSEITANVVQIDGLDKDIVINTASIVGLDLITGNYVLKIHDPRSIFFIDLTVVQNHKEPTFVEELLAIPAPESIRWGYVSMRLAEQPQWRFQALQIAETWKLNAVRQAILTLD